MQKVKKVEKRGGRIIKLTKTEYNNMITYHQRIITIEELFPGKSAAVLMRRRRFEQKANQFELRDDGEEGKWPHGSILYFVRVGDNNIIKWKKLYVPEWEVANVCVAFHGADKPAGHFGRDRMYTAIKTCHYGVSRAAVMQWLKTCEICQQSNPLHKKPPIEPLTHHTNMERIIIDLVELSAYTRTNGGHEYVLTMIDCFSKYAWAWPLKTKHSEPIATLLYEHFKQVFLF